MSDKMKALSKTSNIAIIIISVVVVLLILGLIFCYSSSYSIAYKKPIEADITTSFATLLTAILTPAISLISVILYIESIYNQQKETRRAEQRNLQILLNQHIDKLVEIRDNLKIKDTVLVDKNNPIEEKATFCGIKCFEYMEFMFKCLKHAIDKGSEVNEIKETIASYENAIQDIPAVLKYEDEEEYDKRKQEYWKSLRIDYAAYLFKLKKNNAFSYNVFALIYERYKKQCENYFSYFNSILKYLELFNAEERKDQISIIKSKMTEKEKIIVNEYCTFYNKNEWFE